MNRVHRHVRLNTKIVAVENGVATENFVVETLPEREVLEEVTYVDVAEKAEPKKKVSKPKPKKGSEVKEPSEKNESPSE